MSENKPEKGSGTLREVRPLFPRLTPETAKALDEYGRVLKAVHPLKAKHAQQLPQDIRNLSLSLTAERGPGPRANYLSNPANLSAYLYYFLPWNLYRLSRLLPGLDWQVPDGATIVDVGAGPLTLAQALWISRPHLRSRRLRIVCLDQTGQVLEVGAKLFAALAGAEGRNWSLELARGPVHLLAREQAQAITAVNTVNEMGQGRGLAGHEALTRLADIFLQGLAPGGRLLLVEPGTRLGGKLLGRLRGLLSEEGLCTLGPCTHQEACPMLDKSWRSWCHFTLPVENAPDWLTRLGKLAELEKTRVSLSYLEMAAAAHEFQTDQARVVSGAFAMPKGRACYACAFDGLHLLTMPVKPHGLEPGASARIAWPTSQGRDAKTGAWLTPLDHLPGAAPVGPKIPPRKRQE
jgi:ribosomal protein RSM22 (predicted rRNA methylase)